LCGFYEISRFVKNAGNTCGSSISISGKVSRYNAMPRACTATVTDRLLPPCTQCSTAMSLCSYLGLGLGDGGGEALGLCSSSSSTYMHTKVSATVCWGKEQCVISLQYCAAAGLNGVAAK
jgi:hypothetical protein